MQYCTTVSEFEGQNPLPSKACHVEVATRTLLWAPLHPAQFSSKGAFQIHPCERASQENLWHVASAWSQIVCLFFCTQHLPFHIMVMVILEVNRNWQKSGDDKTIHVHRIELCRQRIRSRRLHDIPICRCDPWVASHLAWRLLRFGRRRARFPSQRLTFGFASIFQETLPQPKWPGTKRSLCPRMSKV